NVKALIESALAAGATELKPVAKSLWGFGGVVQAPDGAIWKVATSKKKDTAPVSREFDSIVLLLGASDVAASKRFYTEHGLSVGKVFPRWSVESHPPDSPIKPALSRHRALAKDAGAPADGSGSHHLAIAGHAGPFTDPDGFAWEAAA